jgi:rRNA maturation endonuclease Nob1
MRLSFMGEKESKTIRCTACNTEVLEGSKFCTECGKPLPENSIYPQTTKSMCPKCYAEFPPEVEFCKQCGIKTQQIVDTSQEFNCPRCDSVIEPGLSYCSVCGSDLRGSSHTCHKCKREIPPGMSYCIECGTPLKVKKTSSSAISEKLRKLRKKD